MDIEAVLDVVLLQGYGIGTYAALPTGVLAAEVLIASDKRADLLLK
jgi:hypothetical protein